MVEDLTSFDRRVKRLRDNYLRKVAEREEQHNPDSISKMKADTAIDLIEQCIEIEQITTWLEEESQNKKRTTVLKALDEKMAELEDKDNKENNGSEGEE